MKNIKRILALALLAVTLLGVAMPAIAELGLPAFSTAYVTLSSGTLNIRSDANTSSTILGTVGNGTKVSILGSGTGASVNGSTAWYRVQIIEKKNGGTAAAFLQGWAHHSYIAKTDPLAGSGGTGGTIGGEASAPMAAPHISSTSAPIRQTANGTINAYLGKNCPLMIRSRTVINGSLWYQVVAETVEQSGYVSGSDIAMPAALLPQSPNSMACEAHYCPYVGTFGYKTTGKDWDVYNAHNSTSCSVNYKYALSSAYCPWCGDNNAFFDVYASKTSHTCGRGDSYSSNMNDIMGSYQWNALMNVFSYYQPHEFEKYNPNAGTWQE